MTSMRRTTSRTLAAMSLAALALPVGAQAKKTTFRATLSASQVSIWSYHRDDNRDDPCDASADGNGDQTIKMTAGRRFDITFIAPPKRDPNAFGTKGRPSVLTQPIRLVLATRAERNGDVKVHAEDFGPNCGDNGGGDLDVPLPPDCGTRTGLAAAQLFFHDAADDELLGFPGGAERERDHLTFGSTDPQWYRSDGQTVEGELSATYERCPFYGDYPPDAGILYLSKARLDERRLFDRRRRTLVVAGDHTSIGSKDGAQIKTILAWNLRLKRVK